MCVVGRFLTSVLRLDRFSCGNPTKDSNDTDAPARPTVPSPTETTKSINKKRLRSSGRPSLRHPRWETSAAVNEPVTGLSPSQKTVTFGPESRVDSVNPKGRPSLSIIIPDSRLSLDSDDEPPTTPIRTSFDFPQTPLSYLPTIQEELDSFCVVKKEQEDASPCVRRKKLFMVHPNSRIHESSGEMASNSHPEDPNTIAARSRTLRRRGAIDFGKEHMKEPQESSPSPVLPESPNHTPPCPISPESPTKPAPTPEAWWTCFPPAAVPHPNALTASSPLSIHASDEMATQQRSRPINAPINLTDVSQAHSATSLT
ncbi:uncharacterized protein BDZ99DRAFT_41883 [Mytilinidion resinicola]|uniref:Uncharacterized protein n=1 Tax=Mytilinidion resinicola TaxID=574789 RepID=A0A6A6YLP9_9PEZI|nr:uncharacterized protein BDZ99DRAFT_41883 [Mytilinidion resinicola]KAF2808905.1 hypothetical protein BDZ99DRAFT_41883 [Mytilinidion resinicola]